MLFCLVAFIIVSPSSIIAQSTESNAYLMVHFTGESATGEQIYFSTSTDGLNWTDVNNSLPVLISDLGEAGVRDPSIVRSEDGTKFWILATDLRIASGKGWSVAMHSGSTNLVIWESDDLVNWSAPWLVDVAGSIDQAGCAWAPEAIYDPENNNYVVYWATISPIDSIDKARIYYATTTDFKTFSEPVLYINRSGSQAIIDTQIVNVEDADYKYYRASGDGQITFEGADSILGNWTDVGDISHLGLTGSDVEGPILYKFNNENKWCLLVDQYSTGGGYLPLVSEGLNGTSGFSILSSSEYDLGESHKRHGSVLNITVNELNAVRGKWPNYPAVRIQTYDQTEYVRHYSFNAQVDSEISILADSQWRIVPGLADSENYISIMSVNYPGYYICSDEDFNLAVKILEENVTYSQAASFKKVEGLADTSGVSFQSYSYPSKYIQIEDSNLVIDVIDNDTDSQNSTFYCPPKLPAGDVIESSNNPGYYFQHEGIGDQAAIVDQADSTAAGRWNIVPGLADSSAVSFESVEYPGYYLRHYGFVLYLAQYENSTTYKQDATFYARDGWADTNMKSFESYNFPGRFIRHISNMLRVDPIDSGSDTSLMEDATFYLQINPPAAPSAFKAVSAFSSVTLDWRDNVESDLESYNIYRSEISGSDYSLIGIAVDSEYLDLNVDNGVKYFYIINAVDSLGNMSEESYQDTAFPPDLTDDDKIDLADISVFAQFWLSDYQISDLDILASNWLAQ